LASTAANTGATKRKGWQMSIDPNDYRRTAHGWAEVYRERDPWSCDKCGNDVAVPKHDCIACDTSGAIPLNAEQLTAGQIADQIEGMTAEQAERHCDALTGWSDDIAGRLKAIARRYDAIGLRVAAETPRQMIAGAADMPFLYRNFAEQLEAHVTKMEAAQ